VTFARKAEGERAIEDFERAAKHNNIETQLNSAIYFMEDQEKEKHEKKTVVLIRGPPNRETPEECTSPQHVWR
jgi:hypothetical protein